MAGMVVNPFRPTFGISPSVVAGRKSILLHVEYALRAGVGSAERFSLVSGLRGSGKTVFLNEAEATAKRVGWEVVQASASKSMIDKLEQTALPELLLRIDPSGNAVKINQINIGRLGSVGIDSTEKYEVKHDLQSMLQYACEILTASNSGVFITMDEVQSASPEQLRQLSEAIQHVARKNLNIALCFAGLPHEINVLLEHPGTTFLRRAVPLYCEELSDDDVAETLQATANLGDKTFTPDALARATQLCHGYAYLIQLIGSVAWLLAETNEITTETVDAGVPLIIERMGTQVHIPALRSVPERELEFLVAMAQQKAEITFNAVMESMGKPANQLSTYRRRLINRGLIKPVRHGVLDFTIPFMQEHIRAHLHRYQP